MTAVRHETSPVRVILKSPSPSGGFTLIEIVISLAIVSIVLITLITVLNKTLSTASETTLLTGAVMLAEEKATLAGIEKFPVAGESDWMEDERFPLLKYRSTVTDTPIKDVRQVSIEVRYKNRKIFELDSYVVKP